MGVSGKKEIELVKNVVLARLSVRSFVRSSADFATADAVFPTFASDYLSRRRLLPIHKSFASKERRRRRRN